MKTMIAGHMIWAAYQKEFYAQLGIPSESLYNVSIIVGKFCETIKYLKLNNSSLHVLLLI